MKFDPHELDDIKLRIPLSTVIEQLGVALRGRGAVRWGKSPFNAERTASFKVDDRRGFWHCFSSGRSGDHFDAIMDLKGVSLAEAVVQLGGTRRLAPADIQANTERLEKVAAEDARAAERAQASIRRKFGGAADIARTPVEAYLRARGLDVNGRMAGDLRFAPDFEYRGYADAEAPETEVLGRFPCMLAAIRNVKGEIIGLHRTYLQPGEPKKLEPPGDRRRNKPKKILGEMRGGMIWLSPRGQGFALICGEGIETSLAGFQMRALLGAPDDAAVAAGVSLTNIAGSATGRIRHPKHPDDPGRSLPNGVPDEDRPGIVLPEHVETVFLLVDRDSDEHNTKAHMALAGQRFEELAREVWMCDAPDGMDHNDALLAMQREQEGPSPDAVSS